MGQNRARLQCIQHKHNHKCDGYGPDIACKTFGFSPKIEKIKGQEQHQNKEI